MSNNLWASLPRPFLALAPMEGVTDGLFRQVVARAGRPEVFFTEFTNVSSYASEKGRANALERLEITPSDPPIVAQVWGKNPEHFALCVGALAELGFAGVDLNFGCPDRHVNKAGGGAAMIKAPELALDCLRRAMAATTLPVSVKTRLGWAEVAEFREWLPRLLAARPAALTVHLRTRRELSQVPAHYEVIPELVQMRAELSPETALVVNGDIADRAAAWRLHARFPEVDGFMIGRGVFANPFCFRKGEQSARPSGAAQTGSATEPASPVRPPRATGATAYQPSRAELLDLLDFHLDLFEAATRTRYRSYEPLKHFFKIYINRFAGASEIRARLMATHSVSEARAVLAQIER